MQHAVSCLNTWVLLWRTLFLLFACSWGKHFKNNCARATYCPDKPACKTFAEKLQRAVRVNQQAGVTDIFTIIPATGAGDNVAFAVVVGTYGARGGVHGNPGEREIRDGHLWFNYELSALSRKHISSMPLTSPSAGAEIHFRQGSGGQEDFDVSYNGAAGPWHDNGIPYACKDSPRVIVAFAFCSQQACKMCAGLFQQHFPAEMWASLSNHKGLNIEREAIKRLLTGLKCQVQTAAEAIMRDEEVKVA